MDFPFKPCVCEKSLSNVIPLFFQSHASWGRKRNPFRKCSYLANGMKASQNFPELALSLSLSWLYLAQPRSLTFRHTAQRKVLIGTFLNRLQWGWWPQPLAFRHTLHSGTFGKQRLSWLTEKQLFCNFANKMGFKQALFLWASGKHNLHFLLS